jgi:hypothetical protein
VKSLAQRRPDYPSTAEVCSKVIEASKNTKEKFKVTVMFEYIPLAKVGSVPNDATAFRRVTAPAMVVMLLWDFDENEVEAKTARAREIANGLADVIMKAQSDMTESESAGYANYCMMVSPLLVVMVG